MELELGSHPREPKPVVAARLKLMVDVTLSCRTPRLGSVLGTRYEHSVRTVLFSPQTWSLQECETARTWLFVG